MRIPVGNFGNVVATPAPAASARVQPVQDYSGQVLAQAGSQLSGIADHLIEAQEKSQTIRATAEADGKLSALSDDISGRIQRGELPPEQAQPTWDQESKDLISKQLGGMGFMLQDAVGAHLEKSSVALGAGVRAVATQRVQQNVGANLVATGEQLARDPDPVKSSAQYDSMVRTLGPQAGWDPVTIEKNINTFKEQAYGTKAYTLVNAARNDMGALEHVETQLNSDEFSPLDPQRRATLLTTVEGFKTSLVQRQLAAEQRAELLAARRDRQAAPLAWQAQQQVEQGKPIDPDWIASVTPKISGTSYQDVFQSAVKQSSQVGNFGMKPLADMQAQVAQDQAQINTAGWNPERDRELKLHEQIYTSALRGYKTDPLVEAVERRALPSLAPLDLSSGIEGLATGIRARLDQAKQVETITGAPVSPFTASESAQVSGLLKALPASQKANFLGTLYTAFGDDHAYDAAMDQIKGVDPLMARVGARAASRAQATVQSNWFSPDVVQSAGDVAALMVHGDELLKEGGEHGVPKFPIPKDAEFLAAIRNKVGNLYRGTGPGDSGGDQFVQDVYAVKAYYVARAAQDGDISGVVDSKRLDQAITATLGAPVNFHGNGQVLAPWGMDDATFTTRANVAVADAIKAGGVQDKVLPHMSNVGLVGLGNGAYAVTLAGVPIASDGYQVNKQQFFARNSQWSQPAPADGYLTKLSAPDEKKFQAWVKSNDVPFDPSPTADYDMRGFWKSLQDHDGHASQGVDPNDGQMHFTDYFKTPYHETFSRESRWAKSDAPEWNDQDQLVTSGGKVLFDDRKPQAEQDQSRPLIIRLTPDADFGLDQYGRPLADQIPRGKK